MSMSRLLVCVALLAGSFSLGGCGYRLGPVAGSNLEGIRTIDVPMVRNETREPGIQAMLTDSIIQAFHNDGSLRVARQAESDATLHVTITDISYAPTRSITGDTRVTAEYRVTIQADVKLVSRSKPEPILHVQSSEGTEFFVGRNLQESQRQSIGVVSDRLARRIAEQVTEGW